MECQTKLLRLPDVILLTGMSKALIYKLQKDGKFPQNIKIWGRMAGWLESDVNRWISERVAGQKQQTNENK
ncbi:MAG: AlpA family transcriptional regulator [Zoogloeaceae bacterium]|jgi:prophage regulatory protein|nr:AlpA family transcriptional regulator [Zoogloeaceae bacterium]